MLAFFQFIFSSFWYFLGFVIISGVFFDGIAKIIRYMRMPKDQLANVDDEDEEDDK